MAHNITERADGTVEFCFTGERSKIWHSLGAQMEDGASIDQWKKSAGLDWEIFESAVTYQSMAGQHMFADKKVLFRSDTKAPLSIVGSNYKVVQPEQVIEFFRDLVELHGFKLSAAGSLFGGKRFWATADVGKTFDVTKNDTVNGQLLLVTSCDSSIQTLANLVSERVLCANTLRVALGQNTASAVKVSHKSTWNPKDVKIDLGLVDNAWEAFSANIKKMAEVEVSDQFVKTYMERKFYDPKKEADKQSTQTYNKIQKLMDLYANGAGADMAKGTAWGLVNAATNLLTHGMREKQDPSRRFWEGSFGSWDQAKSEVYADMVAMSA